MKIYFFTKHEVTWGSSRERIGIYLPEFKKKGYHTTLNYLIPNALSQAWISSPRLSHYFKIYSFWCTRISKYIKVLNLILSAHQFDLIVIQKINLPSFLLYFLKRRNSHIIFDVDDACFNSKTLIYFKKIIVGNDTLAHMAQKTVPSVTILPTAIDCTIFSPGPFVQNKNFPLTIGWAGSGENHFEYLKLLVNPLEAISKKYPISLKIVGSSKRIKTLFQSSCYTSEHIPWLSHTEDLAQAIRSFDIGVMPLTPDSFSEGKCGYKALMYMASGIPTVVSPVGVNQKIVQNGYNGFWAKNEEEWIQKLELLLTEENLRISFSKEGRKTVEKFYSLEENQKKFVALLENTF